MTEKQDDIWRASELASELGGLMLKYKCIELADKGYNRDEINIILEEDLVPSLKDWIASIVRGFMPDETSQGQTLN